MVLLDSFLPCRIINQAQGVIAIIDCATPLKISGSCLYFDIFPSRARARLKTLRARAFYLLRARGPHSLILLASLMSRFLRKKLKRGGYTADYENRSKPASTCTPHDYRSLLDRVILIADA